MPEIILELQKNEYLPGEHVKISGQIKNAIFNDSVELTIESPSKPISRNKIPIISNISRLSNANYILITGFDKKLCQDSEPIIFLILKSLL